LPNLVASLTFPLAERWELVAERDFLLNQFLDVDPTVYASNGAGVQGPMALARIPEVLAAVSLNRQKLRRKASVLRPSRPNGCASLNGFGPGVCDIRGPEELLSLSGLAQELY
jgi:hypothetical protein